jgi:uncharacterized metal-binding protein
MEAPKIQALMIKNLGQKKLMGMQVKKEEVNKILRMTRSEEGKRALRDLCDAFGLDYSE